MPGGDRFKPLALSPQRKKERTFAALLRQLEGLARTQPVLMIFEDLHWIDPTSREFLDLVLARIDRLPVLLVATSSGEPPILARNHSSARHTANRQAMASHRRSDPWATVRFAVDSPLEEAGFELSVPPERKVTSPRRATLPALLLFTRNNVFKRARRD